VPSIHCRGAGDKVVGEIKNTIRTLSLYKDQLKVAVDSKPNDIDLHDFVVVKYLIKDIVDVHSKMLEELSEREINKQNFYNDI
jgi:hypothetical protein